MARRVTPAQFRSQLRQAQQKQKRAIDNYNRAARNFNQAVNNYNREVRAHNSRVRANRARLQAEVRRLNSTTSSRRTVYVRYSTSVQTLASRFDRLDAAVDSRSMSRASVDLAEMSENETANSVGVLNSLLDESPDVEDDPALRATSLEAELRQFSEDLVLRWRGALFSLNPSNPDAARHFCTSAREILTLMIQGAAPDAAVLAADPACLLTPNGTPSRRAKVRYLLGRKDAAEPEIEDFVEEDLDNVVELFEVFNKGTHGAAGRYTVRQLMGLRERVESAIVFMHRIVY
jgi:hypothetical protein